MTKIVTVCSAGLVRSAALADVLKMHFEPADVISVGIDRNDSGPDGAIQLLFKWADHIVIMHEPYVKRVPAEFASKVMLCEVGRDTYGNPCARELIDQVWQWARQNTALLGIQEHSRRL